MHTRTLFPLTAVLLAALVLAARLRAQETESWRFGVIEAHEAPNSARELDTSWTRFTFQWADVQPSGPNAWSPPVSDEEIETQIAAGRDVVGLLIGIPDWARDSEKLPSGLWLAHDDPQNLWANYVREAVSRYAGSIDHWVIWNEPDIDATAVAHTWDGTVDDFYQLQRIAYLVAKETNPGAVIHLAAFTYWADVQAGREQYMARLLDRILEDPDAPNHNYYFDAATAHLYFQAGQIYDLLLLFRSIMAERNLERPIWLIETNAPPFDDPSWPVAEVTLAVTENEQAAFMPQGLASALAAGADRVGVFKLRDTETDRQANPEPFGLLRLDGSRRPAYNSWKVATQQMRGVREATRVRWDEIGQFALEQADRRTTVLFSRLPISQTVQITAVAPTARLVNMWGEEEQVEALDGQYEIELQSALCAQTIGDYCMIGGTTLYLIEALDGGPPPPDMPPVEPPSAIMPTLPPLPTLAATPSLTPAPSAAATATGTATPAATPTATPTTAATPSTGGAAALPPPSATAVLPPSAEPTGSTAAASVPEPQPGTPPLPAVALAGGAVLLLVGLWLSRRERAGHGSPDR